MDKPTKKSPAEVKVRYENKIIAEADIDAIIDYALNIAECRFVMAEPILKEDEIIWNRYLEALNWNGIE